MDMKEKKIQSNIKIKMLTCHWFKAIYMSSDMHLYCSGSSFNAVTYDLKMASLSSLLGYPSISWS